MLVEGLGTITFVNGLLRIETVQIKSDGTLVNSGQIEIPGNCVGGVIDQLVQGTQGISDKLNETTEDSSKKEKESKSKKDKNTDKKKN